MISKSTIKFFLDNDLVYSATSNQYEMTYTEVVTGDLDQDRAIAGELKCWRMPKAVSELKQKKIIITDFTPLLRVYSYESNKLWSEEEEDFEEFRLCLALLHYKFELYAWTGKLVPLKNEEDLIEHLFKIKLTSAKEIIHKLSEYGFNKDECVIADANLVGWLASQLGISTKDEPSFRRMYDLMSLPCNVLDNYLKTQNPNIPFHIYTSTNLFNKFNCIPLLAYLKSRNFNPVITIQDQAGVTVPDSEDLNKGIMLINSLPEEITSLIEDLEIDDSNCNNFNQPINAQDIAEIFNKCPNIKSCTLNTLEISAENSKVSRVTALETLNITNNKWIPFYNDLLNNSPNLKILDLQFFRERENEAESEHAVEIKHLPALEALNVNLNVANHDGEYQIVQCTVAAPNLHTLTISWLHLDSAFVEKIQRCQLKNIKTLTLDAIKVDEFCHLIAFINQFTNLEQLTINFSRLDSVPPNIFQKKNILQRIELQRLKPEAVRIRGLDDIIPAACNNVQNVPDFGFFLNEINDINEISKDTDIYSDKIYELYAQNDEKDTNFLIDNTPLIPTHNNEPSATKTTFDGATANDGHVLLKANQYFRPKAQFDIPVNHYRLTTFRLQGLGQQLGYTSINRGNLTACDVQVSEDIIADYEQKHAVSNNVFLGTVKLYPKDVEQWIKLPSLSPFDTILAISAGAQVNLAKGEDDYHYLCLKNSITQPVVLHFLLQTTPWLFDYPMPALDDLSVNLYHKLLQGLQFNEQGLLYLHSTAAVLAPYLNHLFALPREVKIGLLASFCKGFSLDELSTLNSSEQLSPWQALNLAIAERKGVCRHRARVFVALANILGVPAQLISNDCHEFVEVWREDGVRFAINLGGGQARLKLKDTYQETINKEREEKFSQHIIDNLNSDNPYLVWEWASSKATDYHSYAEELFTQAQAVCSASRNILIGLKEEQVSPLLAHTQVRQRSAGRRYYTINNLDDIKLTQNIINKQGEKIIKDSPLVDFLKQAETGDVLIVNLFDMKAEHTKYNTMMDSQKRQLKGIPLPDGLLLVCLQPAGRALSEDFHSRFPIRSLCPGSLKNTLPFPEVNADLTDAQQNLPCIDFYFPNEYKQYLTVRFSSQAGQFNVSESLLIKAIQHKDKGIVLRNAPRNDKEFIHFFNELFYLRQFNANGTIYKVPLDFEFFFLDKPFSRHPDHLKTTECPLEHLGEVVVLNELTFKSFFSLYHYQEGHFNNNPGWIERYQNRTLRLVESEKLSETHWALLEEKAAQHNTTIEMVTLNEQSQMSNDAKAAIFYANDLDLARVNHFSNSNIEVIPVSSQTSWAHLIETFRQGEEAGFNHQVSYLANCLLAKKQVLLVGETLSLLLKQQLTSLLLPKPYFILNGQPYPIEPGQVKLLTRTKLDYPFCLSKQLELPAYEEYWDHLRSRIQPNMIIHLARVQSLCQDFAKEFPEEPKFSFIQLQTMIEQARSRPGVNPLKSILRLKPNYPSLKPVIESLWDESIRPNIVSMPNYDDDVMKKRIAKVNAHLETHPYVFIVGSSGSGKSTLFLKYWEQSNPNAQVFVNLEQLKDWYYCTKPRPVLFIDEANLLGAEAFSFLEGLFNPTPALLIDGELLPVSKKHKLIFAGNYGHFSDRVQQSFFARHGHIIKFGDLPAYIQEKSVRAILETAIDDEGALQVAKQLIEYYKQLQHALGDTITSRNLEMSAWRYIHNKCSSKASEGIDPIKLALIDEYQRFFKNTLDFINCVPQLVHEKKELKHSANEQVKLDSESYVLTKSRKNPLRLLEQLLTIREFKQNSPSQYFTGLQGLILEGYSAEGKTSLITHYLTAHQFVLATPDNKDNRNRYYLLEDLASLQETLDQAFHEGAVVVIDEMNVMPVEHLLNYYLSGRDLKGKIAQQPGFCVLATQNPISYDYRRSLSPALLNRFHLVCVKEYKKEEIYQIAKSLCANPEEAEEQAEQFISARDYSDLKSLVRPNVRTLVHQCSFLKRGAQEELDSQPESKKRRTL